MHIGKLHDRKENEWAPCPGGLIKEAIELALMPENQPTAFVCT